MKKILYICDKCDKDIKDDYSTHRFFPDSHFHPQCLDEIIYNLTIHVTVGEKSEKNS